MGFSVQKLTRPLITVTAAIVLLGTGTGAAMAATGAGTAHHSPQVTRKQLCARAEVKAGVKFGNYLVEEYVLQNVEGDTLGAFTIPDAVLTLGDTAFTGWEIARDLGVCSGPEKAMPKPKLPPFLQHIKKNEYGGGDD